MADVTKYTPINGGTLKSDLKSVFYVLKTRRTMAFAYGFMFAFVALTAFFALNPSPNSSSPWFTNIFSLTTNNTSMDSNRSQFSSVLSYFYPNNNTSPLNQTNPEFSPPQPPPSLPPPPQKINPTRSNSTTAAAATAHTINNHTHTQTPTPPTVHAVNNQTKSNQISQQSPLLPPNQTATVHAVNNQTKSNQISPQSQVFPPNQTAAGKPEKKQSGKSDSAKKEVKGSDAAGVSVKQGIDNLVENLMSCDLFDGGWVMDDSYPLYKPGSCSLIDEQFGCIANGRPDKNFQKYKWKPKGCTLPRMNGAHMLELLRGKRLVFVGDSLNRNMWESLVCILKSSLKDQTKVFEANGRSHFRGEASYSFIFKDYNCTVEFFVSPFLVREWEIPDKNGTKETLRLDLVGRSSDQYKGADIIIFNTGHWWTHDKTAKGKDYYQEGSHVYGELNVLEAFRKALTTWARWVDSNMNPTKSFVFFRGYSASHFSGGQWNSGGACDSETEPIKNETYLTAYPPKMKVLEGVLKGMKTHVTYLNITRLTDYRKDGHPSVYRKLKKNLHDDEKKAPLRFQDCSHWCLPGVPDAWNELLYAELLVKENKMKQHQKRS